MSQTTHPILEDYTDKDFDPYVSFDRMSGAEDVTDIWPRLQELEKNGAVQKGDARAEFGVPPFPFWTHLPSYMLFGYDNVSKAFFDGTTFSSTIMMSIYTGTFGASINGMDAPEHMRYRRLFQRAFLPGTVAKWGAELVPKVVDRRIDRFIHKGKADLVQDFTIHYPFDIVYEQLALPVNDLEVFKKLTVGLMCVGIDPEHAMEGSQKLGVYLEALLQARGEAGTNDLIGLLARAEVEGEKLPTEIAVSFLRQLMNASGDTTYRSTSSFLVGLLSNPDQFAAVKADRSLIPQAIEEALRWEGPLTIATRQTTCDVEMDGVLIPRGAKVDLMQASANHDATQFENPERFNIFRPRKRNLAFAYGAHICIGQHLARIEMERAINMLLDRLGNLRLDPDYPPPSIIGVNSRAPKEVRVVFDA